MWSARAPRRGTTPLREVLFALPDHLIPRGLHGRRDPHGIDGGGGVRHGRAGELDRPDRDAGERRQAPAHRADAVPAAHPFDAQAHRLQEGLRPNPRSRPTPRSNLYTYPGYVNPPGRAEATGGPCGEAATPPRTADFGRANPLKSK